MMDDFTDREEIREFLPSNCKIYQSEKEAQLIIVVVTQKLRTVIAKENIYKSLLFCI